MVLCDGIEQAVHRVGGNPRAYASVLGIAHVEPILCFESQLFRIVIHL